MLRHIPVQTMSPSRAKSDMPPSGEMGPYRGTLERMTDMLGSSYFKLAMIARDINRLRASAAGLRDKAEADKQAFIDKAEQMLADGQITESDMAWARWISDRVLEENVAEIEAAGL